MSWHPQMPRTWPPAFGPQPPRPQPRPIITANGRVLQQCPRCRKWVRLNKPLLGDLHVCA